MDLQSFVADALTAIVQGVVKAQRELHPAGARVNPIVRDFFTKGSAGSSFAGVASGDAIVPVLVVDFDVAVTVNEGSERKGGIGVVTGFLSLGGQSKADQATSSATRLKFCVPIAFPAEPADRAKGA
jgi:hypothetical protein